MRRILFLLAFSLLFPVLAMARSDPAAPAPAWTPPDPARLKDEEIHLLRQQLGQAKAELEQAGIGRLVYETQLQVAALHGYGVQAVVHYAPLTDGVIKRMLADSTARQYPDRAMDHYLWLNRLFGALPPGTDLMAIMQDLMSEQAAGVYDPATKTLYVRGDFPLASPTGRMVLAHEIGHAFQDQNYSLEKLGLEDAANDDHALAILAIAEGDATLLMGEYLNHYASPVSLFADLPKLMMMNQDKFDRAPPAVQETMLFPYLKGMAFFQTLDGRTRGGAAVREQNKTGGWRDAIFSDPPATTAQILHPDKYLRNQRPAPIEPLRAEQGTSGTANVIGEFGIGVLLEAGVGHARAEQAAAGWAGDRILIADNLKAKWRTLRWVTRWETARDADEFAAALEEALKAHYAGRLTWQGKHAMRTAELDEDDLMIRRSTPDRVELQGKFGLGRRQ